MTNKGSEIKEELEQLFPKDGRVVIDCVTCNANAITYIPKSILVLESYYGMSYKDRISNIINNIDSSNYILSVFNSPFYWINDEFCIDIFDVIENRHYIKTIKVDSNNFWEEQLSYETASMLLDIIKNNNENTRRR